MNAVTANTPAAWLTAIAVFVAAGQASNARCALAQAMPNVDVRAVWQPSNGAASEIIDCERGSQSSDACRLAVMTRHGASPQALALARWLIDSRIGLGYITRYRAAKYAPVAAASVFFPGRANTNSAWYVFRGSPPFIDVERQAMTATRALNFNRTFQQMRMTHPNADLWPSPGLITELRGPAGGSRLVFRAPILAGCHACEVLGGVDLGYDFDMTGGFRGVAVVAVHRVTGLR
jgi:hypothetical protein